MGIPALVRLRIETVYWEIEKSMPDDPILVRSLVEVVNKWADSLRQRLYDEDVASAGPFLREIMRNRINMTCSKMIVHVYVRRSNRDLESTLYKMQVWHKRHADVEIRQQTL